MNGTYADTRERKCVVFFLLTFALKRLPNGFCSIGLGSLGIEPLLTRVILALSQLVHTGE